jgi:hypothetical protein
MSTWNALGHLAGGFNQGYQQAKQRQRDEEDRQERKKRGLADLAFQDEQRNAWRAQQGREQKKMAVLDAGDVAASDYLRQLQSQHDAQQSAAAEEAMAAGTQFTPTPWKPTQEHMLRASERKTNFLLENGRVDEWQQQWIRDENMRAALRKKYGQEGLAHFKATQDPTRLLKGVYDNVDDGYELGEVKPVRGPLRDGKPLWEIQRRKIGGNGDVESVFMDAGEIEATAHDMIDPTKAVAYSIQQKLQSEKSAANLEQLLARLASGERVAGVRADASKEVAKTGADGRVKVAAIRGPSSGGGGGGSGGGGNWRNSPLVIALDKQRVINSNDITSLTKRLETAKSTERGELRAQIAERQQRLKDIEAQYQELAKQGQQPAGGAAQPRQGAVKSLPQGAKQIGTSGGRPVYQTPDGKKFIQD